MWRRDRLLFLVPMMLGLLGTDRPARAQDEAEPKVEQPAQPDEAMTDDPFDQRIYGPGGPGAARNRIESDLAGEIGRIDQMYRLSPDQKKKLSVAGRGDIKRLFDRAEQAKAILHRSKGVLIRIPRELRPLPNQVQLDLFGGESLFAKTLKSTLTTEQRACHEREQLAFYRSRVEWMVPQIHHGLQLSDEQRRRFVDAIVEETRPLEKYGKYDLLALLFQATRLPEGRLKTIFDDAQWGLLRQEFDLRGGRRSSSPSKATSPRVNRKPDQPRYCRTIRNRTRRPTDIDQASSAERVKRDGIDRARKAARRAVFQRVSRMWQRFSILMWAATMLPPGIDSASAAQEQDPDQPARKSQRAIERAFGANDLVAESVEADDVADTEVSRERLEKRLAWQINRLDQVYGLTAEQKKKLEIAGRGDIKRLFERIREKEVTLRRLEEDFQRAREPGNAARLLTAMREVRDQTKGLPEKLFIEGSIFVKTLKSTFRSEQRKTYEKDQLEFYRSRVEWAVVGGLGTLKLSDDQSRQFVIQIVEQTHPSDGTGDTIFKRC